MRQEAYDPKGQRTRLPWAAATSTRGLKWPPRRGLKAKQISNGDGPKGFMSHKNTHQGDSGATMW